MLLPAIVIKNLLHRPVRTLLTLSGIAIAIGALVALRCVASGFQQSWERLYSARGTDLIVTRMLGHSLMPELFDEALRAQLDGLPGVAQVAVVYDEMMGIEELPMVFVFGWDHESFLWHHLTLISGRWPTADDANEVAMGHMVAELLGKRAGDQVQIETDSLTIAGIYESGAFLENSAIIAAKRRLQRLMGNPGKARFFNVQLEPGVDGAQQEVLCAEIGRRLPGFKAYRAGDVARHNSLMRMARTTSWATSLIALLIGTVGVMNTMLMSVFERTREIGILLAVGWRRSRVIGMILGESLLISALGGALGVGFGAGLVRVLRVMPRLQSKIEGEIGPDLIALALTIALALGLLGGLYPALRASRMETVEALRHE